MRRSLRDKAGINPRTPKRHGLEVHATVETPKNEKTGRNILSVFHAIDGLTNSETGLTESTKSSWQQQVQQQQVHLRGRC